MKLVAIGIGSAIFGVNLLRDLFRTPEFRGSELALVDIDASALDRMSRLAQRLNRAARWDVTLESTSDRREALPEPTSSSLPSRSIGSEPGGSTTSWHCATASRACCRRMVDRAGFRTRSDRSR